MVVVILGLIIDLYISLKLVLRYEYLKHVEAKWKS